VQQELMRHADIRTTVNVYAKAMHQSKRHTHSEGVRMVLARTKNGFRDECSRCLTIGQCGGGLEIVKCPVCCTKGNSEQSVLATFFLGPQ
jgi:hypothetical protein